MTERKGQPGNAPKRIQRKRSRGWRMPEGAVYVGRPGPFGNPFKVEAYWAAGYSGSLEVASQHCVDAYRAWILGQDHWAHSIPLKPPPSVTQLRGKDLACWCPLGRACHADALLEICNAPQSQPRSSAEAHYYASVEREAGQ
jgi:hypothetical protein